MGLFNELGRRVEKFKQSATDAAGDAEYGCRDCEATFVTDYDECPECGSSGVVAVGGE